MKATFDVVREVVDSAQADPAVGGDVAPALADGLWAASLSPTGPRWPLHYSEAGTALCSRRVWLREATVEEVGSRMRCRSCERKLVKVYGGRRPKRGP